MTHITIDVVVPVFNRQEMVNSALQSLAGQIRPPNRVIVVDDGSDPPLNIQSDAFSVLNVELVRNNTNEGPSKARNVGICRSRADVVAFLDSDDVLHPRCIECLAEAFERGSADMAYGRVLSMRETQVVSRSPCQDLTDPMRSMAYRNFIHSVSGFAAKRSFLDAVGGFDEELCIGEDLDLYLRLLSTRHARCIEIPLYLVLRRLHHGNLTDGVHKWAGDSDRLHRKHMTRLIASGDPLAGVLAAGFIRRVERLLARASSASDQHYVGAILARAKGDYESVVADGVCEESLAHSERCNGAVLDCFLNLRREGRPSILLHLGCADVGFNSWHYLMNANSDRGERASIDANVLCVPCSTAKSCDDRIPISFFLLRYGLRAQMLQHEPSDEQLGKLLALVDGVVTSNRKWALEAHMHGVPFKCLHDLPSLKNETHSCPPPDANKKQFRALEGLASAAEAEMRVSGWQR